MSSVPLEHQARCGVLAVPETEVRGRPNCSHPEHRRREGERMRVVYGSGATEECTLCGAWRNTLPGPAAWRPASEPRSYDDE
jgi:hypothetical protein